MSSKRLIKEEIYFNGGLDSDSDEKFINQGDYVDALNIGKFYDGDGGIVTNANGNSVITNAYLPAGTNKCIGWCPDDENNAVIFFNYNSNSNHGIYRLLKDDNSFQKILHNESILGFVSDCRNLQAHVIGDLLYWNEGKDTSGDYINVPRKINITKAYNYTNGISANAYDSITDFVLSVIKPPYLGYLNAIFTTDLSYAGSNNFYKKDYYRFAIQYVYDDNEVSVLGNFSNIAEFKNNDNNYVAVRFYYQDFTRTVSKVRVYVQKNFTGTVLLAGETDVSDSNGDNFYNSQDSAELLYLTTGTHVTYRWYGITGVAYSNSTNIYDSVPLYANTMTFADNRIMYGDCVTMDDVSEAALNFSTILNNNAALYDDSAFTASYGGDAGGGYVTVPLIPIITNFIPINSTHFIDIYFYESRDFVAGAYSDINIRIDCKGICPYWSNTKIMDYIVANTEVWATRISDGALIDGTISYSSLAGTYTLKGQISGSDTSFATGANFVNLMRYSKANNLTYKSGSRRLMAAVYYDLYGRTTGYVIKGGITEGSPIKSSATGTSVFGYETTISPLSQDVAYMSIVVSENLDYIFCQQYESTTYSSVNFTFTLPSNYIYTNGDIVRLFSDGTSWTIISADETYLYFGEDIGYVSNGYEILRPRTTETLIFNEVKTFYINGNPVDGEYTGASIGDVIISDGDCWSRTNYLAGEINRYESFYDDTGILIQNSGRPFLEKIEFDQNEYQYIYFSQKYFDNTNINGLSTFLFDSKAELSDDDGDVIDLKKVGEVLYAIQRREITSFYLGKTILKQSSTGEVTADTSQVLGGKRESAFNYGSVFQTARMDNNLYGFDIYKGIFWMNAYNGVQVISGKVGSTNYKMDTYFKEKAKALLASGIDNISVYIGIDKPNDTVYVTFVDASDSGNNETIAYHQPSNRWISKYSFIPERYLWLDDKMYSFKAGKMYVHDDNNQDKCKYYDVAYNSYIQFVSHEAPNIVKVFNTIAVHANKEYTVNPIEIEANSSYTNGMYSKILSTDWVKEEGVYKAAFNKNMKTRSSNATNYDLINGEDLRGKVVKVKMTNSNTSKVELLKVDITSELSH